MMRRDVVHLNREKYRALLKKIRDLVSENVGLRHTIDSYKVSEGRRPMIDLGGIRRALTVAQRQLPKNIDIKVGLEALNIVLRAGDEIECRISPRAWRPGRIVAVDACWPQYVCAVDGRRRLDRFAEHDIRLSSAEVK